MMRQSRPTGHTWADLDKAEELSSEDLEFDALCFRVLSTPEGQKFLAYLHEITTFKRNAPNSPDGALRELEAQRRLVAIIEARISRYAKGTRANGGRTRTGKRRAAAAE